MLRFTRPAAALAVLLSLSQARALDPELLRLADPEANVVAGIRLAELAASPLMAPMLDQARTSNPEAFAALDMLGPNPWSLVEELLIFGKLEGPVDAEKSEPLLLIRGGFSQVDWKSALCAGGCTDASHGGMQLNRIDSAEQEVFFVLLDGDHAAMGPGDQVRSMIDRKKTGGVDPASVEGWASSMNDAHFWLAAKGPFDVPDGQDAGMVGALAQGLVGLGFGLTLGDDVTLGLELASDSEENAQQMLAATQAMLAMASLGMANDPENAEFSSLLQSLKINRDQNRVSAALSVPANVLMSQIQAKMAETIESSAQDEEAASPPDTGSGGTGQVRQPSVAPRQGTITIHGLEPAPVEVEAQPKQER